MFNQILEIIAELKVFIIVSIAMSILMGAFLLIFCRKFAFDGKNLKVIGFFYDMKAWDSMALAVGIAKVCLCISFFITSGKVSHAHMGVYIMLHLLYMIHRSEVKGLPNDIFNGIATCVVMGIMGMLYDYLRDVMFDWRIKAVTILMMIIICGYALCDLFCSCGKIIMIPKAEEKEDGLEKRERKQNRK